MKAEHQREEEQRRKRRATMSDLALTMANAPITKQSSIDTLHDLGIADEDMIQGTLVVASVFKSALKGDMKAVEKWSELTEPKGEEEKRFRIPAESIGKAFVDINRRIKPNNKNVFKGGRGALKSSYVSIKVIELLKNTPNLHGCIVRKVASTLKDSVYSQVKWAINELGLDDEFSCKQNPLEITLKKTGQKIFFRGADDPIKLKSIKPEFGYIGILWVEEVDQLKGAEELRSIEQSTLRGGAESYEFISFNPPKSSASWINRELLLPDDKRIIHDSNYLDAPAEWLGQKFIDDAEHLKLVNPKAYEHEYMGIPNGEGGNVFEYLELRSITDDEIKKMDRIYQGVDFGWYPDQYAFLMERHTAELKQ